MRPKSSSAALSVLSGCAEGKKLLAAAPKAKISYAVEPEAKIFLCTAAVRQAHSQGDIMLNNVKYKENRVKGAGKIW